MTNGQNFTTHVIWPAQGRLVAKLGIPNNIKCDQIQNLMLLHKFGNSEVAGTWDDDLHNQI
jgi:hypothetical protein